LAVYIRGQSGEFSATHPQQDGDGFPQASVSTTGSANNGVEGDAAIASRLTATLGRSCTSHHPSHTVIALIQAATAHMNQFCDCSALTPIATVSSVAGMVLINALTRRWSLQFIPLISFAPFLRLNFIVRSHRVVLHRSHRITVFMCSVPQLHRHVNSPAERPNCEQGGAALRLAQWFLVPKRASSNAITYFIVILLGYGRPNKALLYSGIRL